MKDESVEKIIAEFAALRPKLCSYLKDNYDEDQKYKEVCDDDS